MTAATARLLDKLSDGAWRGRRAFVVGGGPSLQGFDFRRLDGERWIACNEAFRHGPATISFSVCHRFMREHVAADPEWGRGPGLSVFMDPPPNCRAPHVATHSNGSDVWGASLEAGLVEVGVTGIVALNLAEILGADPIYLLGMDCGASADGRDHFHEAYPREWKIPEKKFAKMIQYWRRYAPAVRSRVVVVGPSAIDCFERATLEEVLP